ncbi:MAG: ATP-binding protein [Victivallaceae bacterium]|nr:ATP-binding protein [Victivallaceae bacterium]
MTNSDTEKIWRRLRRKTGTAIAEYRMIEAGDRLLLGVSGGKDSMVLLKLLSGFVRRSPVGFSLAAATFDPGYPGFRIDRVRRFAEECGVEFHVCGMDVGAIIAEKPGDRRSPCVICSRLRRGVLSGLAHRLNCNKLVLAQHLDDAAVSLLIGLFRGQGLTTMGANVPADGGRLRVIRPLITTPESDIKAAAATLKMRFSGRCPYAGELKQTGDRAGFARLISRLEKRIPNVRENMLEAMRDVRPEFLLDRRFLGLDD